MELVTVKTKFQIVIPQRIRKQAHVAIGDLLEASVEHGKITFTPKTLIDRHLAEGLDDVKHAGLTAPTRPPMKPLPPWRNAPAAMPRSTANR